MRKIILLALLFATTANAQSEFSQCRHFLEKQMAKFGYGTIEKNSDRVKSFVFKSSRQSDYPDLYIKGVDDIILNAKQTAANDIVERWELRVSEPAKRLSHNYSFLVTNGLCRLERIDVDYMIKGKAQTEQFSVAPSDCEKPGESKNPYIEGFDQSAICKEVSAYFGEPLTAAVEVRSRKVPVPTAKIKRQNNSSRPYSK